MKRNIVAGTRNIVKIRNSWKQYEESYYLFFIDWYEIGRKLRWCQGIGFISRDNNASVRGEILDNSPLTTKAHMCQHISTQHTQEHRPVLPARMYYCFQYAYIIPLIKTYNQQHKYYCHQCTYHCLHLCIIISMRMQCSTSICNTFK